MISIVETEPHLEAALSEARFRHATPDARLAWQAFREFTRVRVSVASDRLVVRSGGVPFALTFGRRFEDPDEDTELLTHTLRFAPDPALQGMDAELWSDGLSTAEWFAKVEALPGFQAAMARTPVSSDVSQDPA